MASATTTAVADCGELRHVPTVGPVSGPSAVRRRRVMRPLGTPVLLRTLIGPDGNNYALIMSKPIRTARELKRLLLERLGAILPPDDLARDVHLGAVRPKLGPGETRQWAVPVLLNRHQHSGVVRAIQELQAEFDLDDDYGRQNSDSPNEKRAGWPSFLPY